MVVRSKWSHWTGGHIDGCNIDGDVSLRPGENNLAIDPVFPENNEIFGPDRELCVSQGYGLTACSCRRMNSLAPVLI